MKYAMWPQALEMTRDECRGVLRRIELESYAQVITAFRAQGALSDQKAKLLEELRAVFHISQERHRAEARRVVNDEELNTIAEAISGPDTWQDWSREGRRSFPLLPRMVPQSALTLIANHVAKDVAAENAKLPYPSDTGKIMLEEQNNRKGQKDIPINDAVEPHVVFNDPFKMPELPTAATAKKNLKRVLPHQGQGVANKKRVNNKAITHQDEEPYQHITASTHTSQNTQENVNKTLQLHKTTQSKSVQKTKAAAKKKMVSGAISLEHLALGNVPTGQRQATPAKCGRRAQKPQRKQSQLKSQNVHSSEGEKPNQLPLTGIYSDDDQVESAAKKDMPKPLMKVHVLTPLNVRATPRVINTAMSSPTLAGTLLPLTSCKVVGDKCALSSTVQKYIVEDRQSLHHTSTSQFLMPECTSSSPQIRPTTLHGSPSLVEPLSTNNSNTKFVTEEQTVNQLCSPLSPATGQTPSAFIQLPENKSSILDFGTKQPLPKVLSRNLLPIVLSSSATVPSVGVVNANSNSNQNIINIGKIETVNNDTAVVDSGANQYMTGSSTTNDISTPTVLIAGQSATHCGSNSNNVGGISSSNPTSASSTTPISGKIFRKPTSNFVKTSLFGTILGSSSTGTKAVFTTSNIGSGPHTITNIKTPVGANSPIITTSTPQQFLKKVPSTGLRPVQICQSPTGKVFIQPAGKLSTVVPNKCIAVSGGTCKSPISNNAQQQRIAIQKMQIIPVAGSSGLSGQSTPSISIGSGNVGNSCGKKFIKPMNTIRSNTSGTITLTKNTNLFKSVPTTSHIVVQKTNESPKPKVVVISAAALQPQTSTAAINKVMTESNDASFQASTIITEDTPVDILSTPISLRDTEHNNSVIGVTDWEMELDQATASSKTSNQHQQLSSTIIQIGNPCMQRDIPKFTPLNSKTLTKSITPTNLVDNSTVFMDDCFEDVIVEEHEDDDFQVQRADDDVSIYATVKSQSEQSQLNDEHLANMQSKSHIDVQEIKEPCKLIGVEFDNADAGFDETVANNIETVDENTAAEYIVDD